VKVTVLGKSPSWQDAGGACSGYLVEHDEYALLLDCGGGVFGRLRVVRDYLDVDAVLITHLHSDHFLDLVPFSYALLLGPRSKARVVRPELHAPPQAGETFRALVAAWEKEDLINDAFDLCEYQGGGKLSLGPLQARFCEVPHYTRAFAVELTGGGRRFTFGADCGPNEALAEFAADTDLLLLEATLSEPELEPDRGHMTAREAGELARAATARRLVVTHFSDELDPERLHSEARAGYGGEVELARHGAVYTV